MLRFTSGSTAFLLLGQQQLGDLPSMDNVNHLIDNFLLFTLHIYITGGLPMVMFELS
jgi:hypothetical protein